MHFQTFTGNSFGATALPFFIFLGAFFTSSLLTRFNSSLTTSASSVLGLCYFPRSSVSESTPSISLTLPTVFILYNPHVLYIFPCSVSLRLANLYNSFSPSFVSNLAYKSLYARPFAIATAFFALLFFFCC